MKRQWYWVILVVLLLMGSAVAITTVLKRGRNEAPDGSHLFVVSPMDEPLYISINFSSSANFSMADFGLTYLGDENIYVLNQSRGGYGYQTRYEDAMRIEGDTLVFGVENDIDRYYQSIKYPTHDQSRVGVGLDMQGRVTLEKKVTIIPISQQKKQHQLYLDFFRTNTPMHWVKSFQKISPKEETKMSATMVFNHIFFHEPLTEDQKEEFRSVKYLRINFFYLEEPLAIDDLLFDAEGNPLFIDGFENYFSILRTKAKFASITLPISLWDNTDTPETIEIAKYYGFYFTLFDNALNFLEDAYFFYDNMKKESTPESIEYIQANQRLELRQFLKDEELPFIYHEGFWQLYSEMMK